MLRQACCNSGVQQQVLPACLYIVAVTLLALLLYCTQTTTGVPMASSRVIKVVKSFHHRSRILFLYVEQQKLLVNDTAYCTHNTYAAYTLQLHKLHPSTTNKVQMLLTTQYLVAR